MEDSMKDKNTDEKAAAPAAPVVPPGDYTMEGLAAAVAVAAAVQPEDLTDLPEQLVDAIEGLGLRRAHVAGHRIHDDGVTIVTHGGRTLTFPGDEAAAAALTESDKDGVVRSTAVVHEPFLTNVTK